MDFYIDINQIEEQFLDFMRFNNCEPEGLFSLQMDGQIHRYRVKGDKHSNKSGAYCVFTDNWPAGWCMDWHNGEAISWCFNRDSLNDEQKQSLSEKKYQELFKQSQAHQAEMRKQQAQLKADASERARILVEQLPEADKAEDHPYIHKKQIYSYGLKIDRDSNALVVPLRNIDGQIVSLQWIYQDGEKRFYPNATKKGNFFSIALETVSKDEPILIGEGVATMSTVYELTGLPCIAAMNAGNIKPVAEAVKKKFPHNHIVIIADNDHKKDINTGRNEANEVNRELQLDGVVMPDFSDDQDGTDWNDFYALHDYNEDYVRQVLRNKFSQLPAFNKRLKYKAMAQNLGIMNAELIDSFCKPLDGDNFLIQDWIPTESMMMMFAPSGSGKGFVAIDLAYAIATPSINEWHGKKVIKHGPVVYLAGEGQKGMRKRCKGFKDYKGLGDNSSQFAIIKEALPINDVNEDTGINKLIANIGMLYPDPALVIIDTTNRYMMGDENKTADATSFVQKVTQIMNEFHCSVLIIHHTGLSPETQGRARGSSVFKAAMDMEFRISKSGMFITLEMTKTKDTDIQKPLVFEMLEVPAQGFFKYGGIPDTTCVLKHNEEISESVSKEKKQEKKMTKSERFARETYRDAALEFGKIVQQEGSARSVVAVDVEDWRKICYRHSAADNAATLRSQFNRARALLLEEQKILSKQIIDGSEFYCLIKKGDDYELSILNSMQKKHNASQDML